MNTYKSTSKLRRYPWNLRLAATPCGWKYCGGDPPGLEVEPFNGILEYWVLNPQKSTWKDAKKEFMDHIACFQEASGPMRHQDRRDPGSIFGFDISTELSGEWYWVHTVHVHLQIGHRSSKSNHHPGDFTSQPVKGVFKFLFLVQGNSLRYYWSHRNG